MLRLLITAGPTREHIDPVRFLSNASTGRMGVAIATAAAARGHDVHLVVGPVDIPVPEGVHVHRVISAVDMLEACLQLFPECHAAVMTAAVCDYRPAKRETRKLPKHERGLTLALEPTPDICARLGAVKEHRVVVGFALEDHDHRAHAEEKLRRKNCDAIVLNTPENIAADQGRVEVLRAQGGWSLPLEGSKGMIAESLVSLLEDLVSTR
ncbi:MAG: phosphopantothenoylcysteine decarboxylase [Phycisphaerae bacterium]|nr:phosphopantothenoylcysteine decarboxylase [Phycisphaerae bacterium]